MSSPQAPPLPEGFTEAYAALVLHCEGCPFCMRVCDYLGGNGLCVPMTTELCRIGQALALLMPGIDELKPPGPWVEIELTGTAYPKDREPKP